MKKAFYSKCLKFVLVTGVVTLLFFIKNEVMGSGAKKYPINYVAGTSTSGDHLIVGGNVLPGSGITDFVDNTRKALLSPTTIEIVDYMKGSSSSTSAGHIDASTCTVNTSSITIKLGNACLNTIALSSGCGGRYQGQVTLTINQEIYCGNSRMLRRFMAVGVLDYSGCAQQGTLKFTLPPAYGIRASTNYTLNIGGDRAVQTVGTNPCASPVPQTTPLPMRN